MSTAPTRTAPSTLSFTDLGVPVSMADLLSREGITDPFPIQTATLPDSL